MLSKSDLIFLGASIVLGGQTQRGGISYITNTDINKAMDIVEKIFNEVFNDNTNMILED